MTAYQAKEGVTLTVTASVMDGILDREVTVTVTSMSGTASMCIPCSTSYCSLGSHKMKGSAHSTYAVPATALQILLMLARYIPCTPSALDNVV